LFLLQENNLQDTYPVYRGLMLKYHYGHEWQDSALPSTVRNGIVMTDNGLPILPRWKSEGCFAKAKLEGWRLLHMGLRPVCFTFSLQPIYL